MYQLTNEGFVVRLSDEAHIPLAEEAVTNRDRQEYEEWLDQGNKPLEAS